MRNDWLLFFHLLFAFLAVGGVMAVTTVSLAANRARWTAQVQLLRAYAFRANLVVVFPSLIATYVFGEVLASEVYDFGEPDWLELGRIIGSVAVVVGGILLTLLQLWVLRRTRAGKRRGWPEQMAAFVPPLVLAALAATIVLMSGKPA